MYTKRLRWLAPTAIAVGATMIFAACGDSEDDADEPAGGEPAADDQPAEEADEPVTLRMAHPFAEEPTIEHFQNAVEIVSDGTLGVQVSQIDAGPDEEQRIVAAVAAGDLDLGWVGTRAFTELGVTSFDALTAPFLIDSYPLEQAVLDSDIPDQMLAGADELGVTGLAVIGGGLRKPFAVDGPLLGPDDYSGITFRTFQSAGHAEAIAALGATHSGAMAGVDAAVREGAIQAIENTLRWYGEIDSRQTPYITANVNLWPQTMALVASPDMLAGLSDSQASSLREAAADTAARSVELSDEDSEKVGVICEWGGRLAEATDTDVAALRQAVQPVYDQLAQDADTAGFISEIENLKESVAVEPLAIPDGCAGSAPAVTAEGEDDPDVLNGTYLLEWTVEDLVAAGLPEEAVHEFEMAGVFTWTFDHGELQFTLDERQPCTGTYGVSGDMVNLLREAPCPVWLFTATWELTDAGLVLSDTLLDGEPEPLLEVWLAGKPWERID